MVNVISFSSYKIDGPEMQVIIFDLEKPEKAVNSGKNAPKQAEIKYQINMINESVKIWNLKKNMKSWFELKKKKIFQA